MENEQPFQFKIGASFPAPLDVGATYLNGSIRLDYARVSILGQTIDMLKFLDPEIILDLKERAQDQYEVESAPWWEET